MKPSFLLLVGLLLTSCSVTKQALLPDQPIDYSKTEHWAALPSKVDPSDLDPFGLNPMENGPVDIFFLYPTSFLAKKDRSLWNAAIDNKKVNRITDGSSMKYQASIFNQVGRVYAPRYRQAHYQAYFTTDKVNAKKAFELAYQDVKDAFQYYLEHYNQGRPIIIAAHSQGTTHGMRLTKEFFDGTPLQVRLVVAYLAGIPIPKGYFDHLSSCDAPDDLQCINSWRTFKYGHEPKHAQSEPPMIITNPISWRSDTVYVSKAHNKGALLRKFEGGLLPNRVDAQVYKNVLWVHKPKFPGSFLYRSNNFHIADFNFFYFDVRENAKFRKDLYLKKYN